MTDNNHACNGCHRFFCADTGDLVKGWETVYVVSPGPDLCRRCKEAIIDALEKVVPI